MRSVHKRLYLVAYVLLAFPSVVLYACVIFIKIPYDFDDTQFFLAVSLLAILLDKIPWIIVLLMLYKMWQPIRYIGGRATPWQAVLYMFVPLFNLYWVFQVLWGWTRDYNRIVEEGGLQAPRMPEKLALTTSFLLFIYVILSVVTGSYMRSLEGDPYFMDKVGPLLKVIAFLSISNIFLIAVFLTRACKGINAIVIAIDG